MLATQIPYKRRSLYTHEFWRYENIVLTEHARQRLAERSEVVNLVSRVAKSKYGYIDYKGLSHIFLQDDNIELIGEYKYYAFKIITILSVSLIQYNHKMKSRVEL